MQPRSSVRLNALFLVFASIAVGSSSSDAGPIGYYRQPAIHGDTIVFVAEGDLWKVPSQGGVAARLTTHPGAEANPVLSPDGSTVAFTAQYEGPAEIYTMPLEGGLPKRWTFEGARCMPVAFTPDGKLVTVTQEYAGLPDFQAVLLDLHDGSRERVPLSQAADVVFSDDGHSLFFVRFPFQGSQTKRYQGGTAQDVWRFDPDSGAEAINLTADHPGTDRNPMVWKDRVYFVSDRDGTMNIWSMAPDGSGKQQHTHHTDWDVKDAALSGGKIAYQLGADIRLLDLASGEDRPVPITLDTDLDQTREKWIDHPWKWLTAAHLSPSGDRVALTARGQVFVAPQGQGRLVEVTRNAGVRYRDARFDASGAVLALSDQSGEVEFWRLPADGTGSARQITRGARVLRWEGVPSPDGKRLAHHDKNHVLWVTMLESGATARVDSNGVDDFADLTWSPDSRWLAYVAPTENLASRIRLYDVEKAAVTDATTDRYASYSPAWSADGKRLYFLSDRALHSVVRSPWGARQPEPFYDRMTQIYELSLLPGLRSPFEPENELVKKTENDSAGKEKDKEKDEKKDEKETKKEPPRVAIDTDGLTARLLEVPIEPGDYSNLFIAGDRLYWMSQPDRHTPKRKLMSAPFRSRNLETLTVVDSLQAAEPSADGKKILIRTGEALCVIESGGDKKPELDKKSQVDLSRWAFSLDPREEWRQMFVEGWRLERDYFYDPNMHGVDWTRVREKYAPLVDRVSDRAELSDLLAQMVSELSALHIFVYGGDIRTGEEDIQTADLGAELTRDPAAGGLRVTRLCASDPDRPSLACPLMKPGVDIKQGDVIVSVNGVPALAAADPGEFLRHLAGQQVLLEVRAQGTGEPRRVIVTPMTSSDAADRRYHEWEYTRRLEVEKLGKGRIGYVHLRAMGGGDFDQWAREFYPVFNKEGLIIDVRHNRGGNIDSWLLARLLRKSWFWWAPRGSESISNMQYAFNGHVTVLCDESTASDGEAFAEGFRRLGLGKVIGTRTWGGEIWLSSSNFLVDRGIATAAESGVYGPEGSWLIEGHGVDPDIVVDNLPHATFEGKDAQLETAVSHLLERIAAEPVTIPKSPPYPDKSFGGNKREK